MTPFEQHLARTPFQTLLDRVPPGAPNSVRDGVKAAFTTLVSFSMKASSIRRNADLTRKAQDAEIQEVLRNQVFGHFRDLNASRDRLQADVKALRDNLRSGAPGPNAKDLEALDESASCLSSAVAVAMMMVQRASSLDESQYRAAQG